MEQSLLNIDDRQLEKFALSLAGKQVSIADKIQNAKVLEWLCQNKPSFKSFCGGIWQILWREDIGGKIPRNVNQKYLEYLTHLSNLDHNERIVEASRNGFDKLLLGSIKRGGDIHYHNEEPLKESAKNGHANIVKILLENGANIHIEDDLPVILAAMNGHSEVLKLLIANDANFLAQNNRALRLASNNGHREAVSILINAGAHAEVLPSKQRRQYLP